MTPRRATSSPARSTLPSRRFALIFSALFILAHIAADLFLHTHLLSVSLLFSALCYLPAISLCVRRALLASGVLRLRWFLWTASLIAAFAEMFSASLLEFLHLTGSWHFLPPGCLVVSVTLVILVVATPPVATHIPTLRIYDALVCFVACIFCNVVFFSTNGLAGEHFAWANYLSFLHMAAAIAALLATRLYYTPAELKLIHFVALFQSLDFVFVFFSNYLALAVFHLPYNSPFDFTSDIPALILFIALLTPGLLAARPPRRENYFIRSALPLFLAFSPLLLGIYIVGHHLVLGLCGILLGSAFSLTRGTLASSGVLRAGDDLRQNLSHLTTLANRDSLTPALNRRAYDQAFDEIYNSAPPESRLTLILLDLDNFKFINDTYGHRHGDRCLCAIAEILLHVTALYEAQSEANAGLPPTALVSRFGGDEFVILLPRVDPAAAATLAEAIQTRVRALHLFSPDTEVTPLTVSIGLSSIQLGQLTHPTDLFDEADRNLYTAKREGRNRTQSSTL